ncbi:E3 ubiquitin-protein ligase Siah2-like isoform X2 [Wyeomyia smithii]|nr:E3 ubiquitin-protein ligase Siah2-like isoform X2 [Wyeomyia smithii]XP_055534925.1 E3 ubiquitin-protein ligase Siah2-like isoform X2 [Wyeomyia smithii]XP_055534927.1 E3 ubiquitin-protein ligase Siah2-like isoform X2 [Wyeomyia smithii]
MDLEKVKCVFCHRFPDDEVYECSSQHLGCKRCVESYAKKLCSQCLKLFDKKKANPIEQLVKNAKTPCPYKSAGCTWAFSTAEMRHHTEECKFRPYRCIATKLQIIGCNWTGLQYEIESHLRKDHVVLGNAFSYYQESAIPFSDTKSRGSIKLVDAFSKQFLFYFFSNVTTQMVYFMIIYFGRREEARQYYYEFDIRSQNDKDIRRIKYVEQCTADCDDLLKMIDEEKCVVVSFKTIKHFLQDDSKIPFRFIVKKIDKESEPTVRERRISENNSQEKKTKTPKPTPFVFPTKGQMKANVNRSSPVGGTSAGASGGHQLSPKSPAAPPARKISAPANLSKSSATNFSSEQRTPIDFSSINRVASTGEGSPILKQESSPLLTPSINRNDAPPSYNTLTGMCRLSTQPYKMSEDRIYLQRYPEDCLGKPLFKR